MGLIQSPAQWLGGLDEGILGSVQPMITGSMLHASSVPATDAPAKLTFLDTESR